jgi:hypothetical protein
MKISYRWLKEYVDFDLTPHETAKALTSIGLEVGMLEEVETVRGGLKGLFVGKVLTCEPLPNSDHLHITTVDLGRPEPQQIVCGAPNVKAGQKVIVADLGCVLYKGNETFIIKKSKLRGIDSFGMICAEDEIGVGTSHDGIIILPDNARIGMPAAEYYKVENDWVFDIDITPNRADALSHYGVARDLHAWLIQNGHKTNLHRPSCDKFKVDNHDLPIEVKIKNTDACRRYACLSITDCEVKESPQWLKNKLSIVGLRPINNIVDITNYIMLAYGQPMHCFDADMVTGNRIIVRDKNEGRRFVTLDGTEHTLGEHDLAICNDEEPMCIAGVFGGKGSGTYDTTRNVVLESAYFHPTWIRKSSRRHGLSTDASFRFERGIDPTGIIYALKQAAILCKELAGGKISMEICDEYPTRMDDFSVRLNYEYCDRLIGKQLGAETIKNIITALEMRIEKEDELGIDLVVPAYRVDVQRPCDVVEEILRIYGYNNIEIPTSLKSALIVAGDTDRNHSRQQIISEQLVGEGFNEILNNSLTMAAYYDSDLLNSYPAIKTVRVMNPLSTDLGVMRQTLLFGGLESIRRNVNRKAQNLRFFEFGNTYLHESEKRKEDNLAKAYTQQRRLALWITGKRIQSSWAHPDEESSFYELKAYVENILARLGLKLGALVAERSDNNIFESGLVLNDKNSKTIAELGTLNIQLLTRLDISQAVFYAELHWDTIMKAIRKNQLQFTEIPKYPAVSRDLALLVDKAVEFAQIEQIARETEKKNLRKVELFDVYEGKKLPAGKKSYAINFILQDDTQTLTDKAIESIMHKLIKNITNKLGAELR